MEGQQSPAGTPGGVERGRMRSAAAALTSLMALAATSLVAGPAVAKASVAPCALPRTQRTPLPGRRHLELRLPPPHRTARRGHGLPVVPGQRARPRPVRARRRPLPGDQRLLLARLVRQVQAAPRIRNAPGWRCPGPRPRTGYSRDWPSGRRSAYLRDAVAAADATVDFSRYDIVYFVADPDAPGVDSDATKVVNFDRPLRADGVRHPACRHRLRTPSARPQCAGPRDRARLRPAGPLPPAGGRQGRLGHLRRRLGRDGQPVRHVPRPVRLAQVEARLARRQRRAVCDPVRADHAGADRGRAGSRRQSGHPAGGRPDRGWAPRSPSRRAPPPATTARPARREYCSTASRPTRLRAAARSRWWTPIRRPRRAGTSRSIRSWRTRR